jgi:hypothetical protein
MATSHPRPDETARAPEGFRDALAELVQIGLSVARLVGRVAEAETALAEAASHINAAEGVSPLAESLAQAIEADRAAAAAAEARQTVVARAEIVSVAFARVSRAIRLTVLLAERLDRGWATRRVADDRFAMARRQIARGVEDAIGREADGERAEQLTEALAERLESLDVENELSERPAEEIIAEICRELGLAKAQMTAYPTSRDAAKPATTDPAKEGEEAPHTGGIAAWAACPPPRRPDG